MCRKCVKLMCSAKNEDFQEDMMASLDLGDAAALRVTWSVSVSRFNDNLAAATRAGFRQERHFSATHLALCQDWSLPVRVHYRSGG